MKELIIAIDLGTSSVKIVVSHTNGEKVAVQSGVYQTFTPNAGWLEQDPNEWWNVVKLSLKKIFQKVKLLSYPAKVAAISFSGHMSAPVLLDKEGEVLTRSILVGDVRSTAETKFLNDNFREKCLNISMNKPLDAFVLSKLLWIRKHQPDVWDKTAHLLLPKDFIRYKMTNHIATDSTDAGNSQLYNVREKQWDFAFIQELDIPIQLFPPILPSTEIVGYMSQQCCKELGIDEEIPVIVGAADMACSQLGTGAINEDTIAITFSTSIQVVKMMNSFQPDIVETMTYHPSTKPNTLYTMSSIFTGGLGINWLLKLIFNKEQLTFNDYILLDSYSSEIEKNQPDSKGVLFLPFLVGSGSPYFNANDRASWLGLSANTSKLELIQSVFEGIGYNIRENIEIFSNYINKERINICVGGGGSKNIGWVTVISNILGMPISILQDKDASAVGATILAAKAINMSLSYEVLVEKFINYDIIIEPDLQKTARYDELYKGYKSIYPSLAQYYNIVK